MLVEHMLAGPELDLQSSRDLRWAISPAAAQAALPGVGRSCCAAFVLHPQIPQCTRLALELDPVV